MSEQYLLSDLTGKEFGPFTVEEMNAQSANRRLNIPSTTLLAVAGSSLSVVARNVPGLVLSSGPRPAERGFRTPEVKKTDLSAALLIAALLIFGLAIHFLSFNPIPLSPGTILTWVVYAITAVGIALGHRPAFYVGLAIFGLPILLVALVTLFGDFKDGALVLILVPFVLITTYCGVRIATKPVLMDELFIDPSLGQLGSEAPEANS